MKKIFITLTTALIALSAAAQGTASSSAALPFVSIQRDAASAAMGSTILSTSGAWSSFSNPAALPFSEDKFSAGLSYQLWQPSSSNYVNLGTGVNIKNKFGVAAGFSMGLGSAQTGSDEQGTTSAAFTPSDLQANVGFSYRFINCLALGVNARYAMNKLTDDYTLSAILFDASLVASFGDFKVLAGVSNVGTKASYGKSSGLDVSYPVASSLDVAGGYSHLFAQKHRLDVNADVRWYFSGFGVGAAAGVGYTWNNLLSVRAGYNYGGNLAAGCASAGIGVHFYGVSLDATMLIASKDNPLANIVSIGLKYSL